MVSCLFGNHNFTTADNFPISCLVQMAKHPKIHAISHVSYMETGHVLPYIYVLLPD